MPTYDHKAFKVIFHQRAVNIRTQLTVSRKDLPEYLEGFVAFMSHDLDPSLKTQIEIPGYPCIVLETKSLYEEDVFKLVLSKIQFVESLAVWPSDEKKFEGRRTW